MNYYDLILGLIPLTLLGLTALLTTVGVGLTAAVPVAGAVSVGMIGHAMFVRTPTDALGTDAAATSAVNQ
ncbi:hypothetical protein M0R88_01180 [Halorussus gelatinilyticus]|uniref:Uncharacterized protein n=1 Tax=Halorussus gelatinilyticus TaxID=2937524 RepID=A0A8U0IHZ7_9EURY|nr:hypothetical protein [Halorussus gelatinilyticus]UPW00730.1 hypothetical protein M0R88_01180 [Halorussus gelatinilyticus]